MIHINILTHLREKLFEKQLPKELSNRGFIFKINSDEDIVWDLVIVYEDIDEPWNIKHKENRLLFISGEPPMVKVYSEKFLNQFDYLISAHPEIRHKNNYLIQQSLPWYFGYNYTNDSINYTFENLEKMAIPVKNKKISFITSNRTFLPGHNKRLRFCNELQKRYSDHLDFYGKGFRPINDKAEAINPYYFSICIENSNIDNYWTEKIADVFLGYTIPVYYGCRNINNYFSTESFFSIDFTKKTAFLLIENLIEKAEVLYKEKLTYIIESRKKCLYEYNLFFSIISFVEKYVEKNISDKTIHSEIQSSTRFHDKDFANKLLKTRRIITKNITNLLNT